MLIRHLLIAPLLLLIALMVTAFFVVRDQNVSHRKDQLTFGTIGEPDTLNPIISQTTSGSQVTGFVFNGLIKRDENLNIVGDLAEEYRITQTSSAFFPGQKQARQALKALEAARDRWARMKLSSCHQVGDRLVLQFGDPSTQVVAGTSYEQELFEIIDRRSLLPVSVMTITFDPAQKFSDGTEATTETVKQRLVAMADSIPGAVVHEILPINESISSVSVIGDAAEFRRRLSEAMAGQDRDDQGSPKPVGQLFDFLDQALLNEPVITFKIRKGVRWQDGVPLTSADAAFTYKCILDPKYRSPRSSSYWPIKYVETPDPLTFIVVYRVPYGECVLSWGMSLIPKHVLEGKSPQWWADNFDIRPIGTGPFRLAEWKRNEFVRLEANPDYFEGPPNLPAVVFRILPDPFVNQVAFDARGFDTYTLAPYQVARYERDAETFSVFQRWGQGFVHIGWNLKKPMFSDRRVRVALAHAINIGRIIKYVYRGYGRPSNGTFPQDMWYANKTLTPYPYDPDKARRLLAEAGWEDSDGDGWLDRDGVRFEFDLITNRGNTNRAAIQALVQDDLKKMGIKVSTSVYEWAVFIKNYINTQEFDACVLGWYLGYSYDLFQLWHSSQIKPPGLNQCSYSNEEVDRLLLEIRTTFDRQKIAGLCARVQEMIYRDQPYLFLLTAYVSSALYRDQYVVRRPDDAGGWIVEPIRNTKAGYTVYSNWWAPKGIAPHIEP